MCPRDPYKHFVVGNPLVGLFKRWLMEPPFMQTPPGIGPDRGHGF